MTKLAQRLASRMERWLGLMRMHGGAQAAMIADVPEDFRDNFSKRVKLMAPLLKALEECVERRGGSRFLRADPSGDCLFSKKGALSVHGSIFSWMSFRISRHSVPLY